VPKQNRPSASSQASIKVRIARPSGRPYQVRYRCPTENREVRISVGSRDEYEAERLRRETEARLLLGLKTTHLNRPLLGPEMEWEHFREQYSQLHLMTVRDSTAFHAESRLDLAERILKPRRLQDLADPHALQQLQSKLLGGAHSRRGKPRSVHTVRGYMNTVLAAVNWAHLQGWLPESPKLRKIKTPKQKSMKGRPITESEFQRMLDAVPGIVGDEAADSWKFCLRGLFESALRLDELMHVSWDLPGTIRPVWKKNQFPVLEIPAELQKNDTEECIPLLKWFESLLLEVPERERTGWIFNPRSLQERVGRKVRHERPDSQWVGKVISKIGKAADVIVEAADERTGRPVKFASAHDLRRTCGERLREAEVPPLIICRVMRHSSWETTRKHYAPGDIQKDAAVLQRVLSASQSEEQGTPTKKVYPENDGYTSQSSVQENRRKSLPGKVHPSGFEPETFGSVDRCSIQLS